MAGGVNIIHPLRCPYEKEIDEIMSNYDHEIDTTAAEELGSKPCFSRYPALNFIGIVWYDKANKTYRCEIWQYHSYAETLSGTLQEIMDQACAEYGNG
jgi:hypothetical protein